MLHNFLIIITTETTMGTDVKKEEVYQNETIMEKYQRYIIILNFSPIFKLPIL